jgi:hypothetical protein
MKRKWIYLDLCTGLMEEPEKRNSNLFVGLPV